MAAIFIAGPVCLVACRKDFAPIDDWFSRHNIVLFSCFFWPALSVIFIRWCKEMGKKLEDKPISDKRALMTLFHLIDNVVGNKSERFANFAATYKPNGKDVFLEITKPELQIDLLIKAVYSFFESIKTSEDDEVRVCLVEMGPKHAKSFMFYEPKDQDPAEDIKAYQNDRCGFTVAKQNKNLLIIEDIQKELKKRRTFDRRYIEVKGDPNSGSIIIFPIRHRGLKEISYCISIYNSQPNYFKKSYREFYNKIMRVFAKRIELEHSLKLIKGKKHEKSNANA